MSLDMVTRTINSADVVSIGDEVAAEVEECGYVNVISEGTEGMAAHVFQPALEPHAVTGTRNAKTQANFEAGCGAAPAVVTSKMAFHQIGRAPSELQSLRHLVCRLL